MRELLGTLISATPTPAPTPAAPLPVEEGLPKILVDWAVVAGSGLTLIALIIATIALWKSGRDLAQDRRRQYELAIIQDIGRAFYREGGADRSAISMFLKMLPQEDFSETRAALHESDDPMGIGAFELKLRVVRANTARTDGAENDDEIQARVLRDLQSNDIRWNFVANTDTAGPGSGCIMKTELEKAIRRRTE